jgi:branched-chain amino acid transport system substrate-binding protein
VATRGAPGASVKSDARSESAVRPESAAIRAAIFQVTDPHGSVIHAGRSEFVRALAFIKDGKPIRYEGVIGPVSFDDYGDITGPFRLWRITNGVVSTVGEMRADEVSALKARIGG